MAKPILFLPPVNHPRKTAQRWWLRLALGLAVGCAPLAVTKALAVSASEATLIEKQFTLPPGFSIRLVAAEPDIVNPMTICVDETGNLFVTEAHTYRWGPKASPYQPPTNPIKRIELGPDGRAVRTVVAATGFAEPVIGVFARDGKVYADCLNELFVMDVQPDGTLANRKLLVKDDAVPWNPFGFYRVQVGPDDKLWLCIADHPASVPVTLTGADGRKLQFRGKTGGMVRCNLDGSGLEVMVQGFRAPYVFDFDPWGHLWHISNGEGSPNLYVHVIPGMDYGYHSRDASYAWLSGKEPLSPPVHEMPGGANTGALHYYSSQFPPDYWGNVLIANWGSHGSNSQNRMVYRFKRQQDGQDRTGTADAALTETAPFLTSSDPMFRPTQLVSAHDGGLYLIDWHGRDDENDTTGRILKIDYTGPGKTSLRAAPAPGTIAKMKPDALVKLLGHPNHFTRECAVRALAKAGAAAVKPLGQTAWSGDALSAANAIWALTRIHTPPATEAMTEALRHTDPRVRAHALRQLRQAFGQPLDSSARVRENAAVGEPFVDARGPNAAALAAPLLRDANGEVRVEAALAQASPGSVTRGLIAALEKADNERLRYQIGLELARHADGEALLPLLNSADASLKRVALIAMDIAAYEKTPLLEAMNKLAPKALEQIPPAKFSQKLEWLRRNRPGEFAGEFKRLNSGEVQLAGRDDKLAALEAIDNATLPEIPAAFVVACLDDRDPRVQEEALRTVRRCAVSAPEVLPATLRIIETTKYPPARGAAIYVLGLRGDSTKAAQWLPLLKDPSAEVATAALRALRQTPQKAELIEALLGVAPELAKRSAGLAEEVAFTLRTLGVAENLCGKFAPNPPSPADKAALARSILARLPKASARLGQLTFESAKGCCATCHSIRPGENRFGPSLAGLGATAQPEYLIESILEPSKVIKTGFESEAVEAKDGRSWSGVVEVTGTKLVIRIAFDEQVIVPLDQIKRRSPSPVSPMPEGLEITMSEQELADLVAHLRTLR